MENRVRLVDLTSSLRDKLVQNGFQVVPDGCGHPSVLFDKEPINIIENHSLINLLTFLANNGVAFAGDYTQTYPPSYAMKTLREKGLYEGKIIECGFDGQKWMYNEI